MDIHVDIRGFLEIHAWICYGFSEQGLVSEKLSRACLPPPRIARANNILTPFFCFRANSFVFFRSVKSDIPENEKAV